jgi:hypothetical protein
MINPKPNIQFRLNIEPLNIYIKKIKIVINSIFKIVDIKFDKQILNVSKHIYKYIMKNFNQNNIFIIFLYHL